MEASAKMVIPLQRVGTPEEAAGAMLLLASPYASYITAQVFASTAVALCGVGYAGVSALVASLYAGICACMKRRECASVWCRCCCRLFAYKQLDMYSLHGKWVVSLENLAWCLASSWPHLTPLKTSG